MRKTLILAAVLLVALSTNAAAQLHSGWIPMKDASDDSTSFTLEASGTATTTIYPLANAPVLVDADGDYIQTVMVGVYWAHATATVDSLFYALDYYVGKNKVATGSTVGVAATSGAVKIIQTKNSGACYDGFRLRILNNDSAAIPIITVQPAYFLPKIAIGG